MQMEPFAQSQALLDSLLVGQSVSSTDNRVSLGPLSTPAAVLLSVLIAHFEDLDNRTGEDQITQLRAQCTQERNVAEDGEHTAADGSLVSPVTVTEEDDGAESTAPTWRVASLSCCSIRGVALPGKEFGLDLDTESVLLWTER